MANSKETSFNNTISSTLSFITVLFEDLFEAVNIQVVLVGEKEEPKPSITSLNKTNTCDGYDFNIDIINNDEYNAVQKESLMMFEGFCIFGFWKFFKNFFCMLMEVNKTMYGNNENVPKRFLTICIQNHTYVMSHLQLCGMTLWQMKTIVSINHQWIELCLLYQCASLCMEQYAWIHAISSRMHARWFFYPSNYQSHILIRSTWLYRTTWLEKTICIIYGVRIT